MSTVIKENWYKYTIVTVLLIMALSVAYYFTIFLPTSQQQRLTNDRRDKVISDNFDLQQKCAQQSKIFFDQQGGPTTNKDGQTNYFENHYNSRLNKCFILIHRFPTSMGLASDFMFDSAEGKEYAEYIDSNSTSLKDSCVFTINNSQCESKIEFNDFVKQYMEE